MRAALDDAPGVHHQNLVRIDHGGQAVGDGQRGFVLRHALQLGLDGALVGGMQRAGGFVKEQDGRVFMDAVYSIGRHRLDTFRPFQSTCRTLFNK